VIYSGVYFYAFRGINIRLSVKPNFIMVRMNGPNRMKKELHIETNQSYIRIIDIPKGTFAKSIGVGTIMFKLALQVIKANFKPDTEVTGTACDVLDESETIENCRIRYSYWSSWGFILEDHFDNSRIRSYRFSGKVGELIDRDISKRTAEDMREIFEGLTLSKFYNSPNIKDNIENKYKFINDCEEIICFVIALSGRVGSPRKLEKSIVYTQDIKNKHKKRFWRCRKNLGIGIVQTKKELDHIRNNESAFRELRASLLDFFKVRISFEKTILDLAVITGGYTSTRLSAASTLNIKCESEWNLLALFSDLSELSSILSNKCKSH
jgi:hypothetical protein